MIKRFKKPLLMALIIALLLPTVNTVPTQAVTPVGSSQPETPVDPGYNGSEQNGTTQNGGEKLNLSNGTIFMGSYTSKEVTVLKLYDADGKPAKDEKGKDKVVTIPKSGLGQDATWEDAYHLVEEENDWNEYLKANKNTQAHVEFTVQTVYSISTYNNIIGYDDNGNPIYDTANGVTKKTCYGPEAAAKYWDEQRSTYPKDGLSSSGSKLFRGSDKVGNYDYSKIEPDPPTPTPTNTPSPKITGPTNTPTPTTTSGPSKTPTPTPTNEPTNTPVPTDTPTPTPPSGGIVYYSNGADYGHTYSDTCWGGGMFVVSGNSFFRKIGYHWIAWNTSGAGTGVNYAVGTPVNLPAYDNDNILNLYAQWAKNKSILTFHYNNEDKLKPDDLVKGAYGDSLTGGEIVQVFDDDNNYAAFAYYQTEADDKVVVYDEPLGELPAPLMKGYTFCGWSYINDFYGVWLKPSALVSTWKNTDVYAYWKANVYQINFDYNFDYSLASAETSEGKQFLNDYAEITYGQKIGEGWNDSLPEPQRTGYTFEGWYISEDPTGNGAGKKIENGYVYDYPMNITLHAKWSPVNVTVVYKNIVGTLPDGVGTYGEPMGSTGIPAVNPTKTGYTFDGWTVSLNPTSRKITSATICDFTTEPTYLYAQWKPVAYTVTLDYNWNDKQPAVDAKINGVAANIATQATTTILATYSYAYPTLPIPSREGYQFGGWTYVDDNGNEKIVTGGSTICKKVTSHTLTAKWIPDTVTVYYDYNNYEEDDRRYQSINDPSLNHYYR